MRKIVILTEGKSNPTDAKTATGVIRYRRSEVVAVLDSTCAGRTAQEVFGVGGSIPCVASLGDVQADTLLIGIAPAGGRLPESWRAVIRDAMHRGMDVVSGLHFFLSDDDEFRALAETNGVKIVDLRRPPAAPDVAHNRARHTPCFRVHTVGNDCGVGKMVVALEVAEGLRKRGRRARFIATGQTGILIAGGGVAVDAVVSDFVSGAIERQVLQAQDEEFLLIEGQGSLVHPMYSGVTLSLLHGCAPQAMVLCLDPTRTEIRHCDSALPGVDEVIEIYERMAHVIAPSRVVGIALNTSALSVAEADEEIARSQESTGLPTTDVIRHGPLPLVDAVLEAEAESRLRSA
ncbi:MAG: DUF1611 domain-containing protein [Planctomycetota bacterium]|nr:DUF1611 domain-containing protein [Planctomycetota bacterium]